MDRNGAWRSAALLLLLVAAHAVAGERRDIVFDCPCDAEWVAGAEGESGTLTLTGGLRSHRATDSGEVRLMALWEAESERRWFSGLASAGYLPANGTKRDEWSIAS